MLDKAGGRKYSTDMYVLHNSDIKADKKSWENEVVPSAGWQCFPSEV